MSKPQTNTDALFKQKFENFAPDPPEHVWDGVKAGIILPTPSFFVQNWKIIAVAAAVVALITTGIVFLTSDQNSEPLNTENTLKSVESEMVTNDPDDSENEGSGAAIQSELDINDADTDLNTNIESVTTTDSKIQPDSKTQLESDKVNTQNKPYQADLIDNANYHNTGNQNNLASNQNDEIAVIEFSVKSLENTEVLTLTSLENQNITLNSNFQPQIITPVFDESILSLSGINNNKGWAIGLYFSPEMMLNNFDSVELMANYSLGVEPTYYINKHLFIRFGIGASYSRDRGFAKLDYMSNDLLGIYDYVYDVTFDSIDGNVVPTYHTKTVEVWDTVRHLEVNAITNEYVYIQTPLLFGYYNTTKKFNWYFYGGPAFNFMVSKQIDKPLNNVDYVEVNKIENDLPERSQYYFQLWMGAGIEYRAGKNIGIAIEPNYRYYFKNVYKESPYSESSLSGLTLRFGLTYTIQ